MPRLLLIQTISTLLLFLSQSALAETHIVKAKGTYEPVVIEIEPGDTVRWEMLPMRINIQTVQGLTPEGAKEINSPKGEDFQYEFHKEGIYVYFTPGIFGLVGAVIVGEPKNLGLIKAAYNSGNDNLRNLALNSISEAERAQFNGALTAGALKRVLNKVIRAAEAK